MKVVKIWYDDCCESPRAWDNLGVMVCWHRHYRLGDRHDFERPGDFLKWAKTREAGVVLQLPLYLYDHSGLSISTEGWRYPYNDPWDAGQVGWIYTTKERIREWLGVKRVTKAAIEKARNILLKEVEEYDLYLRGQVYGYTIYDTDDWEVLDSCGGFFGSNPIENGMAEYICNTCPEFRGKLDGVSLYDGLLILENGHVCDAGEFDLSSLLSERDLRMYQVASDLAS